MEQSTPDSSPEESKSLTAGTELEIASSRNRPLPWSKRRNFITHFVTATIGIGSLAAVCTFGNTAYWDAHDAISRGTSIDDGFCDIQTASHGSQRLVIDMRIFRNLSFSEAKGIDLVWDMLIGQGGRFVLAYLLARFVVADSLIWTMERTNIPYHYYTNFSFSTVSFMSISSAVKILFKKRDWRLVLTALWMIFAVGHIMAFPTIWSAATSYVAPSERRYEVPDGTLVPINSSDLTLCFTTQDERMRDIGWKKGHIEIGPSFATFSDQLGGDLFEFGGREVSSEDELRYLPADIFRDVDIFNPDYNASANYQALAIYALAAQGIQNFLNMTGYYEEYAEVMLTAPATSDTYNMSYDADLLGLNWIRSPGYLPDILIQQRAIGYGGEIYSPTYAVETWYSWNDSIHPGPGIIPYNSTGTYNNQTFNFEAPWIKFGPECAPHSNYFTDVGQCVCYKDQPLPYDLFSSNYIHCVNKSGYVWGFSSFVALLGLCFLSAWLFGCWAIWLDANLNSVLVKNRKRTYGSLRTSLDLVESVKRDLGDRTYSLSDGELKKELDKCDDIGYSVVDGEVLHIGLMTGTLRERPTESSIKNIQLYS